MILLLVTRITTARYIDKNPTPLGWGHIPIISEIPCVRYEASGHHIRQFQGSGKPGDLNSAGNHYSALFLFDFHRNGKYFSLFIPEWLYQNPGLPAFTGFCNYCRIGIVNDHAALLGNFSDRIL